MGSRGEMAKRLLLRAYFQQHTRGIGSNHVARAESRFARRKEGLMQLGPAARLGWPRSAASLPAAGSLQPNMRNILYAVLFGGCAWATYYANPWFKERPQEEVEKEEHTFSNWSNTHEAHPRIYYQPDSIEELERVVRLCHLTKRKLRPVGSGLSPNGCGFSDEGMVNMALMDKVISIDKDKKQITVQAGARIDQIVDALRPHGLTLENYASINSQQAGGFTQVGAHGSGAAIPPVDERVVSLKLVTPNKGILELSADSDRELFYLARCGLGSLGVVAELTLQCVPAHKLVERTFVSNLKQVRKNHKKWLKENKHLRYMWIPHTDAVVVVQCNPLQEGETPPDAEQQSKYGLSFRIKPMQDLYTQHHKKGTSGGSTPDAMTAIGSHPEARAGMWSGTAAGSRGPTGVVSLQQLTFPELRDKVLAFDPLNPEHVKQVNKAELEYWKRSEGSRVGWSHEILGFDCGGQQWVSEVAFPAGSYEDPDLKDLKYMEDLLQLIKTNNIPAPSPIEQRWSASSRSSMSLASDPSPDRLFSWVGVIMYLPTEDPEQRKAITDKFFVYREAAQKNLWDSYNAFEHWAKIEVRNDEEAAWTSKRLRMRFPVDAFNRARAELDPGNILSNELIDRLFPAQKMAI